MPDPVVVDVADRIATIILNRPDARNALSRELLGALPRAIRDCDARDDVDALILTGADPAFCAGLDLKEIGAGRAGEPRVPVARADSDPRRGPLPPTTKPLIGAINGAAITGGLELALACDFLVASEKAHFADTHARIGIMPGWGLTVLLPEAVGHRRARELSATGNFIDAGTARAWGLVNHVVAHERLLPFTRELAADIVSNDAAGVRRIMGTYDAGSLGTTREAWRVEAVSFRAWLGSRDPTGHDVELRRRAVVERGRRFPTRPDQ